MKVFQFICWWWNKRDLGERWLFVIISLLVMIIPSIFFFGLPGFLTIVGIIACLAAGAAAYGIWRLIKEQWDNYHKEMEKEADEIVNRLAGERDFGASARRHWVFDKK